MTGHRSWPRKEHDEREISLSYQSPTRPARDGDARLGMQRGDATHEHTEPCQRRHACAGRHANIDSIAYRVSVIAASVGDPVGEPVASAIYQRCPI
jgi:hypothetical protein